jgi:ATP-dependent helicase/DNAse subunit B
MSDHSTFPPEAVIITGPVGSGKTEAAIDAILDARLFRPFGTVWVLLATQQQIHAFRERLLQRSPDKVQFGVEFFNFYDLYGRILSLAGDPQRQVADTARYRILRHITAGLHQRGELELFGPIATLPGFIGLLAGLIHELKQGLVQPEKFVEIAQLRGPKDRDLARIYSEYQQFLQDKHLVDRHGAGWLAIHHLETHPRLASHIDLLVVDGFDQFNGVNRQLVTLLAQQVPHSVLTLTAAPGDQGRRFRRFVQARERLLNAERSPWRVRNHDSTHTADRPDTLAHLVQDLFRSSPALTPDDGALRLIEAPDVGREVCAVLRRVKRLLLDGTSPESVAIIARRIDSRYGGALRETARAYGVPLVVREGTRLHDNPAVAALLSLIDLHALDFPRREVLDTLRSPYIKPPDLAPDQIALLERITLEQQVVHGHATWLYAVADSAAPHPDEDGEIVATALDSAAAADLQAALDAHFARITPPTSGTVDELTGWVAALLGPDPEADAEDAANAAVAEPAEYGAHFSILGCIRAAGDGEQITRDILAAQALIHALGGIQAAHELITEESSIDWPDFRAELELAIERATVLPPGGLSRLGRVLATDVLEARGLPHDHVFILGLSDGEFPMPVPDIALYQEGERLELEAAGIDMQTAVERSDDMSLFYQAVGLARRTLTLSRYTVDTKGTPCPPSAYWSAVRAVVDVPPDSVERVPVGAAPDLESAVTLNEAAIAVAAVLSDEHTTSGDITALGVHNALLDHPAWRNVLRGRSVEARREDPLSPFDRHTGILTHPDLIASAAERLGPRRVWSASQLNDYGICPFRFFARRLLGLEELKEPEEGLDAQQIGSINHEILELTYRQIGDARLSITPENRDRALAILEQVAVAVFADAPRRYRFRRSAVWQHEQAEMLRRLRWLVQQDFSADTSPFRPVTSRQNRPVARQVQALPRQPLRQEAMFGFGGVPPVEIDGPAGPIRTRGVIDRLDRAGEYAVVIDYKTGTRTHPVEDMAEGRDVQMMLYLLAAQDLLQRVDPSLTVAGGLFWHINNRTVSGEVGADDAAIELGRAQMHANILDARAGRFAVQPRKLDGGRCVSYCEFGALCRMSRGYMRKSQGGADV